MSRIKNVLIAFLVLSMVLTFSALAVAATTPKSVFIHNTSPPQSIFTPTLAPKSVFAVNALNDSPITVTFMLDGEIYEEEEIPSGSVVALPDDPTDPNGTLPFVAWCIDGQTEPFNYLSPIAESITLVPHFGSEHLVTYIDYDASCLDVAIVPDGDPLPPKTPDLPAGLNLTHWSLSADDSSGPFVGGVTSNITVYPITHEATQVVFVTGSVVIPSQVSDSPSIIPIKPNDADVIRPGYTLSHWSLTPNGIEAYDFVTPLSGTTYLYAVWTPAKVGYVINIWNEVADFEGDPGRDTNNYSLAASKTITSSDPLAGITGETLNTTSTPTAGQPGNTINPNLLNNRANYADINSNLDFSDFYWTDADVKPLSSQGDTIINVYAKRMVFTYKFDLKNTYTGSAIGTLDWKFNLAVGSSDWISKDTTGSPNIVTEGGVTYYVLKAKFGQDLSKTWPIELAPVDSTKNYLFRNFNGYYSAGQVMLGRSQIKELQRKDGYKDPDARPTVFETTMKAVWSAPTGAYERRFYYTEVPEKMLTAEEKAAAIPSTANVGSSTETPDTTGKLIVHTTPNIGTSPERGTTRYYRYSSSSSVYSLQNSVTATGVKSWPGRDIPGYRSITTTGATNSRLTDYYQTSGIDKYTYNGLKGSYIMYYMPCINYDVKLVVGTDAKIAGALEEGWTEDEDSISYTQAQPFSATLTFPSQDPYKNGFTFEGWYIDEDLTVPYITPLGVPVIRTIPVGGVTLYAKYVSEPITVDYYKSYEMTETDLVATAEYSDGDTLKESDVDGTIFEGVDIGTHIPGYGTFRGWLCDIGNDGVFNSVSWGMLLNLNTQRNNVYSLYASFTSEKYTITFMEQDANGDYTIEHRKITINSSAHTTLAWRGYSEAAINDVTGKRGYTVDYWSTEPDGSGDVVNTTTIITGDTTLYAQYKVADYKINYMLNGTKKAPATNNAANPKTYTMFDPDITLADPSRVGYRFVGWYKDAAFTNPVTGVAIPTDSVGTATFYAKWEAVDYDIVYVLNEKEFFPVRNSPSNPATYTIEDTPLRLDDAISDSEARFGAWCTDESLKTVLVNNTIPTGTTGQVTVYARWKYPPFPVEEFSLEPTGRTITAGGSFMVSPIIVPSYATTQTITWESSNPAVASVSSASTEGQPITVTTHKAGSALIKAKTADGTQLMATCSVLAVAPETDPKKPIESGTFVTFGVYPQRVLDDTSGMTAGVDFISYNNVNYSLDPITWRVLTDPNDSEEVLLVSDQILDALSFSGSFSVETTASWADSDVRLWLNGTETRSGKNEFLNSSYFSSAEYNAIVPVLTNSEIVDINYVVPTSSVFNKAALTRAFLLSRNDLGNPDYFTSPSALVTTYTTDYGQNVAPLGPAKYWTRTISGDSNTAAYVAADTSGGWGVATADLTEVAGVRPALVLNLNRLQVTQDGGSDGSKENPFKLEALGTPHGGYATTTSKCGTCHSSHRGMGTETNEDNHILQMSASDACVYCHIDTAATRSVLQVYDGDVSNYTTRSEYGHSFTGTSDSTSVSCQDCHTVHGATSTIAAANRYLGQNLLKDPSAVFDAQGYQKYQDDPPLSTDEKDVALSKWCVGCHGDPHKQSDPMSGVINKAVADRVASSTDPIAWQDVVTCIDCHGAGYGLSAFPHYVDGAAKFLLSSEASNATPSFATSPTEDGVCLRCHRSSAEKSVLE